MDKRQSACDLYDLEASIPVSTILHLDDGRIDDARRRLERILDHLEGRVDRSTIVSDFRGGLRAFHVCTSLVAKALATDTGQLSDLDREYLGELRGAFDSLAELSAMVDNAGLGADNPETIWSAIEMSEPAIRNAVIALADGGEQLDLGALGPARPAHKTEVN